MLRLSRHNGHMRKNRRVPVNLFRTLGVYTLLLALLWTAVLAALLVAGAGRRRGERRGS